MKKTDNLQRLQHILEAISKIEKYLQGYTEDKFNQDEKTVSAVVWQLAVIGEAVANLTEEIRNQNSQITWHKISGTRNHLIHGYFTIDIAIVWDTTQNDLPKLKTEIEKIKESLVNDN